MSKKLEFYQKVIFKDSNYYHYSKENLKLRTTSKRYETVKQHNITKDALRQAEAYDILKEIEEIENNHEKIRASNYLLNKVRKAQEVYQYCLNCDILPFPIIPRSVELFYEFCQLQEQFDDELEAIDIWDKYFIYGKEELEQYLSLGFVDIKTSSLETIIEENLEKLTEIDDSFINDCIIYEERIKGNLLNINDDDIFPSEPLAKNVTEIIRIEEKNKVIIIPNLYEVKIPIGIYYNQAYNLEHICDLINHDVVIALTGGIGRGKTTLANDIFHLKSYDNRYNFKYLVNRSSAKEQVTTKRTITSKSEDEIFSTEVEVKSYEVSCYQSFDYKRELNKNKITLFNCDECQYTFADSIFNEETDTTYNWLLETIPLDYTRHILMGANARDLVMVLAKKIPNKTFLIIDADDDFSYVEHFYHYNNIRTAFHYIDKTINSGKKVVYGTNKIENANALKKKYPNQVCIRHSKHKPQKPLNYDDLPKQKQKEFDDKLHNWEQWELLSKETEYLWIKRENGYFFDCPILISTKANDNGINLCDKDITTVFCEFYFDWITAYQWLGRVRWQRNTNQRVNFFIRTMQRDNFLKILSENIYYQKLKGDKLKEELKKEMKNFDEEQYEEQRQELLNDEKSFNEMKKYYYKKEFSIMYQIESKYNEQIQNITDTKYINNIFNKIYRDILIHKYIFKNNPLITLESANKGITELEWEQKRKAKSQRLEAERVRRIELLDSVLDQRLTSAEFKELAQELNFKNPKGRTIMKPYDEIAELGYKIENRRIGKERITTFMISK